MNALTNSSRRHAWIALGSNVNGAWGSPQESLRMALGRLTQAGMQVVEVSHIYITDAQGGGRQSRYYNAVACIRPGIAPAALLRVLKRLERAAGRRLGRHWGPRPLDLDILSAGAQFRRPHRGRRVADRLILPHPELHHRAFVLVPLAEIAPNWWHPGLSRTAQALSRRDIIRRQARGVKRVTGTIADIAT